MTSRIQSKFAILDVMHGRKALCKRLYTEDVPVIIEGLITSVWGDDDGTSREFGVMITKVMEKVQ